MNQARLWVGEVNPAVWEQAKHIALNSEELGELSSDLNAAFRMSSWVNDGHWKGKGSGDMALFLKFSAGWIVGTRDSDFVEDFKNRHWHQLLSGGLRGFSTKPVMRPRTSTWMTPKSRASAAGTGSAATVMSAWLSRWA